MLQTVGMKRESMERDLANRMTEAQQAVKRLQQDCEHQLEMERTRCEQPSQSPNSRPGNARRITSSGSLFSAN